MSKKKFKLSQFNRVPYGSLKNNFVFNDVICKLDLSERTISNLKTAFSNYLVFQQVNCAM